MDIEGLGEQRVAQLVNARLLSDAADCYRLQTADIVSLEGFGELSARNLVTAIDDSRDRPLANLLTALGIRHVGGTVASALAASFGDLDRLMAASEAEPRPRRGNRRSHRREPGPLLRIERESRHDREAPTAGGVRFSAGAGPQLPQTLAGKSVVVTGTLHNSRTRSSRGRHHRPWGKVAGSVSAKTTAVVVGASPGAAKLTRAEALGVPVLDERGFVTLLETGDLPWCRRPAVWLGLAGASPDGEAR